MSTELDKNILDWSPDCTNHKNGVDFCNSFVKWTKRNCQKVSKSDLQGQLHTDVKNYSNSSFKNLEGYQIRVLFIFFTTFSIKILSNLTCLTVI